MLKKMRGKNCTLCKFNFKATLYSDNYGNQLFITRG